MRDSFRSDHSKLVTAIYAAALDPSRWEDFLALLSRATGDIRTHMFGYDPKANISISPIMHGYDPDFVESYDAHYGTTNSWAPGFATFEAGRVVDCQEMCPHSSLVRTEFYNDWIRPQEDIAEGGGVVLFKDDCRSFLIGGNIRLRDADKLKKPWLQTLRHLLPDLVQAFEIARSLDGRRLEDIILADQDGAPKPAVLILDEDLRIVHASAEAEDMLTRGEPIQVRTSGQIAVPGGKDLALEVLDLWRAGRDAAYGRTMSVAHGTRRYTLRLARLDLDGRMTSSPIGRMIALGRRCTVLTAARQNPTNDRVATLRARYGLTTAEAEVTLSLAEGRGTREIATLRGVSSVTVSNQIKSSLQKTGTHRRSELVSAVFRSE